MALFGRESQTGRHRADRIQQWVQQRTPFALFSNLFGILSVLDAFTLVLGLSAGIGAIAMAILGLRDQRRHRGLLGKRLCYLGITLGAVGIAISVLMWTMVYPMIGSG